MCRRALRLHKIPASREIVNAIVLLLSCLSLSSAATLNLGALYRFTAADGSVLGDEWRTVAAAGLLAVQHFNSRDPSIVPELANISSCNVSFHTEVFDTGSEETRTVQQFLRQYTDSDVSQFDVIVGPARSACSAPVALIAGIEKIPQISYWATSPTLEDRQKYPYFLRTISSDSESTVSAAQLFHFLGYRSVALLYVDDEYGKGYAPAFDSAAAGLGISATPAKFDFHDHDSIDAALAAIAASGLRVFLVAILEDDAMYTLRKAVELGIVGPGFLWIFTDSLRNSFFSEIRDTVLINALSGGGRMGASGANYGSAGYEKMVHHVWPAEDNNLEYYRKHFNPFNLTTNFFSENPPTDLEFYAFDATIAMGLAACAAAMSKSGSLTGEHIHANLVNSSFSGVSGKVQFDRATGNRNRANTNIYLSNFVSNGTVLRVDEVAGRWNPIRGWSWSAPFVYSDGATPPPFPCDPGYYYANELGCDKCPVGTAEASAGVRDSCTKCKKGTFAPNAASLSCGSCPNGQIALTYGSDTCVPCPAGATCTDTSSLTVDAGMWRASWGEPFDVYECPIGPDACPGGIGFGETLCAEGYVGPLCSRCDRHFFLSWSGKTCEMCGKASNHGPSIGVAVVPGLVIAGLVISNRKRLRSIAIFRLYSQMRSVGKIKFKILFFALQVLSEFAQIAGFMVDSKDYPEPANSVSGGLLLAHLNLLKFVPSVCVYPDLDYYNTLLIKTLGPLVVVALFWAWPLSKAIQGKPYAGSRGTAAKMSLFWLELVLLSVSTTIMQCFSCTNIGGRFYLRAQLILPCNGTGRRRAHILVAVLMVLLYPIGVPLLMFALMYPHRSQIQTLMEAVKAQDARRSSVTSVKRMKRASLAEIQTKLSWLIKKFKDYQPACWSHGIVVLVTRLCQTSLMVLCEKQATQAGFASAITLVAINVQRETRPYRRTSDNVVAFISQWLIMLWMFSFQLFLSGAFESIPTVLVGITPVLATTALVAWTCVVVMNETRTQLIQNNSTVDTSTQEMIVRHQNGDSSILTIQDFNTRYKPTHQGASDDLSLAGFGVYRPVSQVWSHQLTTKDIQRDFPMGRFISRSGAPVAVKTGQYIVMPFPQGDDVTIMNADVFENKYSKSTEEAFDGRVVSQAEALQKWEGVLRREGRIFSKVAKVHAQKMTEEGYIETVVDGKFEARRPYDKGDYVVCGSRGGRYPMEEDQFSSRYIISETEQASDPMLSKAGFRLFKAKGKVWSHKLTLEEVAEHFPSGRLLGKWGGVVEVKVSDAMPYIVMPYPRGGEVYSINGALFDSTYRLEDPQRRVPTHKELVVEWSRVFQNEDGSLFDESEVVFAKAAIDECDPTPNITETTEVKLIWINKDPASKKADNEIDAERGREQQCTR